MNRNLLLLFRKRLVLWYCHRHRLELEINTHTSNIITRKIQIRFYLNHFEIIISLFVCLDRWTMIAKKMIILDFIIISTESINSVRGVSGYFYDGCYNRSWIDENWLISWLLFDFDDHKLKFIWNFSKFRSLFASNSTLLIHYVSIVILFNFVFHFEIEFKCKNQSKMINDHIGIEKKKSFGLFGNLISPISHHYHRWSQLWRSESSFIDQLDRLSPIRRNPFSLESFSQSFHFLSFSLYWSFRVLFIKSFDVIYFLFSLVKKKK